MPACLPQLSGSQVLLVTAVLNGVFCVSQGVASQLSHSLALLDSGSVLAWGGAQSGQTGLSNTLDVLSPTLLTRAPDGVRGVVAGGHSSALLTTDAAADYAARLAAHCMIEPPSVVQHIDVSSMFVNVWSMFIDVSSMF